MPKNVKYNYYHKTEQDAHLARMGQKRVSMEALGVYFLCRLLAGKCQNSGHICIGDVKKATVEDLISLLVSDHNIKKGVAVRLVNELIHAAYFKTNRSRKILLTGWESEQAKPKTYEAERKAAWRERQAAEREKDAQGVGNSPETSEQAAAAFAASPASTSIGCASENNGTMSQREMGHCPKELEPESKSNIYIPTSTSTPSLPQTRGELVKLHVLPSGAVVSGSGFGSGMTAGDAAKAARNHQPPDDDCFDIYDAAIPADLAACRLVGESGARARNGYRKKLRRIGEGLFRTAMGECRAAMNDGAAAHPAQLLHAICNRLDSESRGASA